MFPLSSFRLGSAREIGSTQALASWTPVTPPSAAARYARYLHCRRPPPLLPPPLAATAVAAGHCRRHHRLPPLLTAALPSAATAATARRCRYRRRPLLPSPATVTNRCRRQHRPLPPPPATVTDRRRRRPLPLPPYGLCHRWSLPLLPVTAASYDRLQPLPLLPPPPPAAPAAACHGPPGPPAATTVGGGGSWERGNPGRACRNTWGELLNLPQGRDGPHARGVLGPGDPLLPGASSVGGGPSPRPGAGDVGQNRPGRKGASHALDLLRPGQRILDQVPSLHLPGRAASQVPPPVVEIPHNLFAARRSVRTVPRVDHITHLWGISPLDWQMKPCERSAKSAGIEYVDLACRGLMFVPPDCTSWILWREVDRPLSVFEASTGLFPLLTGREPPFSHKLRNERVLMWRLCPRYSPSPW